MSELVAELASRGVATVAGLVLLIATIRSLMRTVVVPRALGSVISDAVSRGVIGITRALARLRRTYEKRDAVLAWAGPTILIAQLITWLLMFLLAYGLLLYGIGGQTFGESLRESGSSLFTLGFADVDATDQTALDFIAAATGPIVIALMIGFLPTIYSAYIDREAAVTSLSVAAGEPAWGPEMLSRHTLADSLDAANDDFLRWKDLAATLRMSHTMYPVLIWVRSSRPYRHYVVSLLAALDAASLMVSLSTKIDHRPAYQLLIQGGQSMEVLYTLLSRRHHLRHLPLVGRLIGSTSTPAPPEERLPGWNRKIIAVELASDKDAMRGLGRNKVRELEERGRGSITLTRAEFDEAVDLLKKSGFPIDRDLDEAWTQFTAARSRYEYAAYAICEILQAPPAPWSGPRTFPSPTVWPHRALDLLPEAVEILDREDSDQPPTTSPEAT